MCTIVHKIFGVKITAAQKFFDGVMTKPGFSLDASVQAQFPRISNGQK